MKKTFTAFALLLKDPDNGYGLELCKFEGLWLLPIAYEREGVREVQKLMRKEKIKVPTKIVGIKIIL